MRITNRGRYALRAAVALARLASKESPVSIAILSEHEKISSVFLEQIFFKLRKSGLIKSARGPKGGFYIAKPLDSITFKNILDASCEITSLTFCNKSDTDCPRLGQCAVHPVLAEAADVMNKYLNTVTLAAAAQDGGNIPPEFIC